MLRLLSAQRATEGGDAVYSGETGDLGRGVRPSNNAHGHLDHPCRGRNATMSAARKEKGKGRHQLPDNIPRKGDGTASPGYVWWTWGEDETECTME
eukprot:2096349-Rhodomonas_salina.1